MKSKIEVSCVFLIPKNVPCFRANGTMGIRSRYEVLRLKFLKQYLLLFLFFCFQIRMSVNKIAGQHA